MLKFHKYVANLMSSALEMMMMMIMMMPFSQVHIRYHQVHTCVEQVGFIAHYSDGEHMRQAMEHLSKRILEEFGIGFGLVLGDFEEV